MELYDIVQIEDDSHVRKDIAGLSEAQGLRYFGVGSLQELKENLPQTNAHVWLVDGRFPREPHREVLFLAPEAIELIRSQYKESRIILFSGDLDASNVAARLGTDYERKGSCIRRELVQRIKEMMPTT